MVLRPNTGAGYSPRIGVGVMALDTVAKAAVLFPLDRDSVRRVLRITFNVRPMSVSNCVDGIPAIGLRKWIMTGAHSPVAQTRPSVERPFPMMEPLEPRRLLAASLTPAFAALPAMLPSAGSDQVTIQLTNTGSSAARGPVTIDLYASPVNTVGPGATLLTSTAKPIQVKAGKSVVVPLRFLSPATLPDGSYFLIATVTGSGLASSTIVSSGPVSIVQPFVDLTSQIVQLPASAVETGRRLSTWLSI